VNHDLTGRSVLFPHLAGKPVVAKLDEEYGSSDGGAVLLKGVDQSLGLTESLAECLRDPRQPGKIAHAFQFRRSREASRAPARSPRARQTEVRLRWQPPSFQPSQLSTL
jgi:hypothetical protein